MPNVSEDLIKIFAPGLARVSDLRGYLRGDLKVSDLSADLSRWPARASDLRRQLRGKGSSGVGSETLRTLGRP